MALLYWPILLNIYVILIIYQEIFQNTITQKETAMTDPLLMLKIARYKNGANCHRINQLLTGYKTLSDLRDKKADCLTSANINILIETENKLRAFVFEEEQKALKNPYQFSSNKRFLR